MSQMKGSPIKLAYPDLATATQNSGVYAWYSSLTIWKSDLEEFERRVNAIKSDRAEAFRYIEEKLDSLVFKKYREDDYKVTLRGPLKPRFEGDAKHIPPVSDDLIERLIDDPSRLRIIADAISNAAPFFTAPLYIGMAKNLRERLLKHKSLIDSMYDSLRSRQTLEIKEGDAGFARQIVARGFDPMSLFVYVQEVDVRTNEQVDVESILNRINFPIFGRN